MKYLLLIYHDEGAFNALTDAERQQMYGGYQKLRERLISRGKFVEGSQLQATSTAASVRVRDGKDLVTDGPFAETHEQLGGYFLIDVDNVDEALAVAKQIPSARTGAVEVRPLVERAAEANV